VLLSELSRQRGITILDGSQNVSVLGVKMLGLTDHLEMEIEIAIRQPSQPLVRSLWFC
jgi:hypothetical protein